MSDDRTDAVLRRLVNGPSPLGKAGKRLARYRVGPTRYEIRSLPYCDNPVPIHREEARPAEGYFGMSLDMFGPCRRCPKCLLYRGLKWRDRIKNEMEMTLGRTWHVTLTFAPIHLAGVISESYRFPNLSREGAIERAAYVYHVQLYLKRLRKSGARFRYFGVPEYGEEHGRLHYHMLFHEAITDCLTKRMIDGQWRSYTHARLVNRDTVGGSDRAAGYVSKYLTKTLARPRASVAYGSTDRKEK